MRKLSSSNACQSQETSFFSTRRLPAILLLSILSLAWLVSCEASTKPPTATLHYITRPPKTYTPKPTPTRFPTRTSKPTRTPTPSRTPTHTSTTTPTPGMEIWLDEALPVCQTAEKAPIQGGQPLAPLLGVRIVDYDELVYTHFSDHKTGVFLLPHIGAMSRGEIATLVCIYQTREAEASYTDGMPGYRIYWTVRLVKWPNGGVLAEMKTKGTEPPSSKMTKSYVYGGYPELFDVVEWVVKLIPNKPENVRFIGQINSMGMTQEGAILASAIRGDTLSLWNLTDGKRISTIKGGEGEFSYLITAFSADSSLLATASWSERTVDIYRVKDGHLLFSLKPVEDQYVSFESLAFSMDGTVVAAGTLDKTILLWKLPGVTISRSLQGFEAGVGLIKFSPDGKFMLSGLWFGGPLRLWETGDYNLHKLITNPQTDYGTAAFSQDGSILGAYTHLGGLQFWQVTDGKEIGLWEINQFITRLAFSPDGNRVATGTDIGNIKLWSYPEGKLIQEYKGHSDDIVGLIFSSDGKILYSGSRDGTAYLWELP